MITLKTGTVMEGSKIKYHKWAVGIYSFSTNIKDISSLNLHRDRKMGQKAAWFMLDEIYFGGKCKNMSKAMREAGMGRGTAGKTGW